MASGRNARPGLDTLRAVAVSLVMLYHAGFPGAGVAWLGVDIFFVLSGFLITTLLIEERERNGGVDLRRFWARRFLRLMPAYWLYLAVITVLVLRAPASDFASGEWSRTRFIGAFWVYLGNLVPLAGQWRLQPLTQHLWSLSVEEQFYFLWPVLLVLLYRLRAEKWVAWLLVAVMAVAIASRRSPVPGLLLQTRGIGILLGSALALSSRGCARREGSVGFLPVPAALAAVAAAALIALAMALIDRGREIPEGAFLEWMLLPAFDLAVALLVAHLWWSPNTALSRRFRVPVLERVGQLAYGIYLYHMVVHEVVWKAWATPVGWDRRVLFGLRLTVFFAVTLLLAGLSYQYLESPFLRLKERFRPSGGQASFEASPPSP